MIKYVLHPGWVRSKCDNDIHYIHQDHQLILYNVDPSVCCVFGDLFAEYIESNVEHLYPHYHGWYRLWYDEN